MSLKGRALPIESDSDDDSRGQTKSYNTKLTHVGRKIIKNAKENGSYIEYLLINQFYHFIVLLIYCRAKNP